MEIEKKLEKLNEEIYCLNYELKTLSELYCYNHAERWVNKFMHKKVEKEHIDRYMHILKYTKNKLVLDSACGAGYGTYLISTKGEAKNIIGVDLDKDAIRYGNYRYPNNNINRFVADATIFSYDNKFDVIVSFETIEHVTEYNKLLENYYKNLNDDGILLISTPITIVTTTKPSNPYHIIEWNFHDFHKLVNSHFTIQEIILQNIVIKKGELSFFKKVINTIYKKVANKIVFNNKIQGKEFEVFSNQYDMNLCQEGYQMLVLEKKC